MGVLRHPDTIESGSLVSVRYMDHALQRNVEPEKAQPIIREAIGRVETQKSEYLYLVVDEYTEVDGRSAGQRKTYAWFPVVPAR